MKEKSKNLIVIIGNGFDLAHGLKTRFSDFADYYLQNVIFNNKFNLEDFQKRIKSKLWNKSEQKKLNQFTDAIINNDNEFLKTNDSFRKNLFLLKHVFSNSFLRKLYSSCYYNWFDIEQTYYKELTKILDSDNSILTNKNGETHNQKLEKLNTEFEEVKQEFQKYLRENINPIEDKNIYYCLEKHFEERENITLVNFNYTNTIESYFRLEQNRDLNIKNMRNIHIHGNLYKDIIFGYGDDTDVNYQRMKNSKEKEYLRYFKTFHYLKNSSYKKFLNALDIVDNYDVLIIGHSLETTDKTILKKILDTDKCDYIELLKRSDLKTEQEKEEAHFELHANLSRIFDSESDLRDKLIPFDWSVNFPIMKNIDTNIMIKRNKELYKKVPILRAVPK